MTVKTYTGEQIVVTFDSTRCLHAAECVHGAPEVFDTGRKPWVLPDAADADHVAEVVRRCPSGALHYRFVERDELEVAPVPPILTARADEPLWVHGRFSIVTDDEDRAETRAAFCRCGQTANRPYCDASGECTGWRKG